MLYGNTGAEVCVSLEMCVEGQDGSLKGMCSHGWCMHSRQCGCEDAGALGVHATCTDDKTIRPTELMASLSLPPPSQPTKRSAGLFSKLY